jgi:hypothetical protein
MWTRFDLAMFSKDAIIPGLAGSSSIVSYSLFEVTHVQASRPVPGLKGITPATVWYAEAIVELERYR